MQGVNRESGLLEDGAGVAGRDTLTELARRELDDERGGAREAMVLPVRSRAGEPWEPMEWQAGELRVVSRRWNTRPPGPHHRLGLLVKPDRDARMDQPDEPRGKPRLRLRKWTRP